MVAQARGSAMVVIERAFGEVSAAFEQKGLPALCRIGEDGTVVTNMVPAVVGEPVAAR